MHSLARTAVVAMLFLAGVQASADAQARRKGDRDRLTSEDLRARPASTVLELIRAKRPSWLSVRGSGTFRTQTVQDPYSATPQGITVGVQPTIVVYVDGIRRGSQEVLRTMSTDDVESIERLDASSATQRFGTGHEHGAIMIQRRSGT